MKKVENVKSEISSKKRKWYNFHSWFLRAFLTALALSYVNVANWFCWKNHRKQIKCSIFGACMLVGLVFYVKLNVDTHNTHELDSDQSPAFPCRRTAKQAEELRELFRDVHDILDKMKIRHFLIYGSIWGAYRAKGPLPWDYDIDIAIISDEEYSKIPKSEFVASFRKRGIAVDDHTLLSSCFYFTRGDFAQVDIDIFTNFYGWMQRTGLATWLLYYNYQKYHRFPAWMVQHPLPKMKFVGLEMEVPRGGKTILKYLYPNDWDTPFSPAACRVKAKEGKMKPTKELLATEISNRELVNDENVHLQQSN